MSTSKIFQLKTNMNKRNVQKNYSIWKDLSLLLNISYRTDILLKIITNKSILFSKHSLTMSLTTIYRPTITITMDIEKKTIDQINIHFNWKSIGDTFHSIQFFNLVTWKNILSRRIVIFFHDNLISVTVFTLENESLWKRMFLYLIVRWKMLDMQIYLIDRRISSKLSSQIFDLSQQFWLKQIFFSSFVFHRRMKKNISSFNLSHLL